MKRILLFLLSISFFLHSSRAQSRLRHDIPGDTATVTALIKQAEKLLDNHPDSAKECARQAYSISEKLGYKRGIAYALLWEGMVDNNTGSYPDAGKELIAALRIGEELKDEHLQIRANNNLGNVYALQYNYTEAIKYFNRSLELVKRAGDKKSEATLLNNIGNTHYYREYDLGDKQFTESLKLYNEALKIQEAIHDTDGILTSLDNIGLVYSDQEKYPEALEVLQRSYELASLVNAREHMMHSYSNMGRVYGSMKYYLLSIDYHNRSMQLARELGSRDMLMYGYGYLSETYAEMHDYANAWNYQKQYSDLRDTLVSEENGKQLAEMQARFESEKKEKEIAQLKEKQTVSELEAARHRVILWAVAGGCVLLIFVALLLFNRYNIKKKANEQLEFQNAIIAQKNKDITDSINYAKRLQRSVIASDSYLQQHLPSHFVLYKPKDIVSGDFYWAYSPAEKEVIIATADCTGHGVPGAFMSVLGASLLNEIITERKVHHPHFALNLLRDNIIKILNPQGSSEETRDGMDITLCRINFEKMTLSFSAANNVLWIARGNDMLELPGDKFPVGKHSGALKPFSLKNVQLYPGDVIYTFTDGYADQFGGPNGKKFKYKELQKLLLSIKEKPLPEQRIILENTFESWRGNHEQVDDMTVIGIRI